MLRGTEAESRDWLEFECFSIPSKLSKTNLPGKFYSGCKAKMGAGGYQLYNYVRFELPESATFYQLMNPDDFK